MIFLDYRFTIPNFLSRLLSYMQAKLPVLAVTDVNTDIGRIIEDGNFGWWCESNSVDKFVAVMDRVITADLSIGQNGFEYMKSIIMQRSWRRKCWQRWKGYHDRERLGVCRK